VWCSKLRTRDDGAEGVVVEEWRENVQTNAK